MACDAGTELNGEISLLFLGERDALESGTGCVVLGIGTGFSCVKLGGFLIEESDGISSLVGVIGVSAGGFASSPRAAEARARVLARSGAVFGIVGRLVVLLN